MATAEQAVISTGLSAKAKPSLYASRSDVAKKIDELRKVIPLIRTKYGNIIDKYSTKYGIDPNLVAAMIAKESGGNPRARSSQGAKGLMQLMDPTAREWGVSNSYDPDQNIHAGVRELARLKRVFPDDIQSMVGAYNVGMGNMRKIHRGERKMPTETSKYVPSILGVIEPPKKAPEAPVRVKESMHGGRR